MTPQHHKAKARFCHAPRQENDWTRRRKWAYNDIEPLFWIGVGTVILKQEAQLLKLSCPQPSGRGWQSAIAQGEGCISTHPTAPHCLARSPDRQASARCLPTKSARNTERSPAALGGELRQGAY